MYIEIDQSGKIEDYMDTVVAFRNREQYTVLLKRKIKTEILSEQRNKYKDIKYRLFAILIFYCIKDYLGRINLITIDNEYEGREADIKKHLLKFILEYHPSFDKRLIRFSSIGKKYKIDNFYLGCFFIRRLQTESAASGFFSTTAPFLAVLRPTPSFHSGRQFSGKMIWLSKSAVMPDCFWTTSW